MSELQLFIHGETPAKKNSRIINRTTGRSFPSKKYSDWHKAAMTEILLQVQNRRKIQNPVKITLHFIHGDNRRRDSDNGVSSILDTLVDAEILDDDNWKIVRCLEVYNSYKKDEPGCQCCIQELTIEA